MSCSTIEEVRVAYREEKRCFRSSEGKLSGSGDLGNSKKTEKRVSYSRSFVTLCPTVGFVKKTCPPAGPDCRTACPRCGVCRPGQTSFSYPRHQIQLPASVRLYNARIRPS